MAPTGPDPTPYHEPIRTTLLRTSTIAFFVTSATVLLLPSDGGFLRLWLITFPAVLWVPLGGHYVELLYLNAIRLRYPWVRRLRRSTRVAWWFAAGLPLGLGCWWTWLALGAKPHFGLPFWWGMPFFAVVELAIHALLALFNKPSFWNGRE
jgi:hypothetical protein